MSTQVAGVLKDPFERPLANTAIDIRAVNNNFAILPGPTVSIRTNPQGEYNFILEPASYAISVIIDGRSVYQGAVTITSTTPPATLPELLKQAEMESELPLNYGEYFRQIQETVKDDADRAQAAAGSVGDELELAQKAATEAQQSAASADQDRQQSQEAYQNTKAIADKFKNLDDAVTETQQNAEKTKTDAQQTANDRQASEIAAQRAEDAAESAETVNERNVRVPQGETINALPDAADRANSVAAFDSSGQSVVIASTDFAMLDQDGKVPLNNIPAAAITDVFPVSSRDQMLALNAQSGDVSVINNPDNTNENGSYILFQSPASVFSNWKPLNDNALNILAESNGYTRIGGLQQFVAQQVAPGNDFASQRGKVVLYPYQYGIKTLEQGATSPTDTASKWEQMRADAESKQAFVIIPPGTYVLPANVRMDADNTEWFFSPGSLLKLHDTQVVNQDFLVCSYPVNQRINGLRFDANRAKQNADTFGKDRCGFIVINPDNFFCRGLHIVSSPGKGAGVVGVVNTTVKYFSFDGVTGGDCVTQVFLLDGNNMQTTWTGGYIGNINIGKTTHAGVAINDGAHNIQCGAIYCDTSSTIWDAVSLRDVWDVQMSTTFARGGTNGCRVFSLNGVTKRISLGDMIGVGATQSGVLLLQVEDVTGGTVGGYNNAAAGLNISQRNVNGNLFRCKNVRIANPVGYDNRSTPAQQYGVLIQGLDGGYIGKPLTYGNTVKNLYINRSVSTQIDMVRQLSTGGTAFTLSSAAVSVSFTWPDGGFDDTEYDVDIEIDVASNGAPICIGRVIGKSATGCVVSIQPVSGSTGTGVVSIKGTRRP